MRFLHAEGHIIKMIFFLPAKNVKSLLRVDMNTAYKGFRWCNCLFLQDINHFLEFFSRLCILQSSSFSTLDYRILCLETRSSKLDPRVSRIEFSRHKNRECQLFFEKYCTYYFYRERGHLRVFLSSNGVSNNFRII